MYPLRGSFSRRRFLVGAAGAAAALAIDPTAAFARSIPPTRPAKPHPDAALDAGLRHLAWVWQFRHDGDRADVAAVLAAHGLGVALKTHDGVEWMSTYDPTPEAVDGSAKVAEFAALFEAAGVPFHAWCVVKGLDPVTEARMAAEVLDAGARSLFIDLEPHPGFWRGTPESAIEFGEEFRRLQPGAWLSVSIDPRPWEIDRIPLKEFAVFSDEVAPQVYWGSFGSPGNLRKYRIAGEEPPEGGVTPRFVLDAAMRKLSAFDLPFHPIGDGTIAGGDEWTEFLEQSFAYEAESVSVWRFGVVDDDVWRLLKDTPPRPLTYTVQPGDTLSALAVQWNSDVPAIAALNGIANPDFLFIGQQLRIPRGVRGSATTPAPAPTVATTPAPAPAAATTPAAAPDFYTVQPGDTLWALADQWGTSVDALVELNGITNRDLLSIGQRLRIR